MRKELDERLAAAGFDLEWADIVRDLDRLEEVTVEQQANRFVLRTDAPGCAASVFKVVAIALPPLLRHLPAATSSPAANVSPKKTPRTPAAWCHAHPNFLNSRFRSASWRFEVFNFSMMGYDLIGA